MIRKLILVYLVLGFVGCGGDGTPLWVSDPMRWCAGTNHEIHGDRCEGVDWKNYDDPKLGKIHQGSLEDVRGPISGKIGW